MAAARPPWRPQAKQYKRLEPKRGKGRSSIIDDNSARHIHIYIRTLQPHNDSYPEPEREGDRDGDGDARGDRILCVLEGAGRRVRERRQMCVPFPASR